jgi:hypothetical protein
MGVIGPDRGSIRGVDWPRFSQRELGQAFVAIGGAHLTFLGERIEGNGMSTDSPGPLLALGRTAQVYAWQGNQILKLFYA